MRFKLQLQIRRHAAWMRPIGLHVLAGTSSGVLVALADVCFAVVRGWGGVSYDRTFIVALLHLFALHVPLYTYVGTAFGLAVCICGPSPRVREGALAFFAPQRLWRTNTRASADIWLWGLTVYGVAWVEAATVLALQARVHRAENVAYGAALAGVGLSMCALLVSARASDLSTRAFTRYRGAARPLFAHLTLCAILGYWAYRLRYAPPEWYRASSPFWLYTPLAACFVYGAVLAAGDRLFRRGPALFWLCAFVPGGALLASAWIYGSFHGQRSVLEEWAPGGRVLIRIARAATDRDGDGYARYFGGGDCDDRRGDVYPSALDERGDGVDADCFDGDGTQPFAALHRDQRSTLAHAPARPNVVLISIDALRPDHLGCAGYTRQTSPNIDALCARGWFFTQASSAAPRSVRSIPAMLTGLYPAQIPFGDENTFPSLRSEAVTIAEAMPRTYLKSADIGTRYFAQVRQLFQGFDHVWTSNEYKSQRREPIDRAIARIDAAVAAGRPFFEWVHLFDVHAPTLHDNTPSQFGPDLVGRYDSEVRIADEHVGQLVAALEARNLSDNTVIAITSDHGEALGEHGMYEHSSSLYQEQIACVLLLAIPGVAAQKIAQPVSLIDLAPTLVHLTGNEFPNPIAGRSLLRFAEGAADEPTTLFAEVLPDGVFPTDIRMIRAGHHKLMYFPQAQRFALYDLASDPRELHDLSESAADLTASLRDPLLRWIAATHVGQFDRDSVIRAALVKEPKTPLLGEFPSTFDGAITFLGAELHTPVVRRGGVIRYALYFRADAATMRDFLFGVAPSPEEGPGTLPEMRMGHFPVRGAYHTFQWKPGQIIRDEVSLYVPLDVPAPFSAHYALRVFDGTVLVPGVSGGQSKARVDLFDLRVVP